MSGDDVRGWEGFDGGGEWSGDENMRRREGVRGGGGIDGQRGAV